MARPAAYQTKYHNKAAIYIALIVLSVFAIVLFINCNDLKSKKLNLQVQYTEQQELLAQEQHRAKELKEFEKETQTKGYKIQLARERLGLTFPDEIYYKENK